MRVLVLLVSMMFAATANANGGLINGDCAGAKALSDVFYDIAESTTSENMYNEFGNLLLKSAFGEFSTDHPFYADALGIAMGVKQVVWKFHTQLSKSQLGDIAELTCKDVTGGWLKA